MTRHSHVRLYVGSPRFYSGNFDNDDHHTHGIYATLKISTPTCCQRRQEPVTGAAFQIIISYCISSIEHSHVRLYFLHHTHGIYVTLKLYWPEQHNIACMRNTCYEGSPLF